MINDILHHPWTSLLYGVCVGLCFYLFIYLFHLFVCFLVHTCKSPVNEADNFNFSFSVRTQPTSLCGT